MWKEKVKKKLVAFSFSKVSKKSAGDFTHPHDKG